jgi:hypothetical protein
MTAGTEWKKERAVDEEKNKSIHLRMIKTGTRYKE